MKNLALNATKIAESGILPDAVLRVGIRHLINQRREQVRDYGMPELTAFAAMLARSPVALVPDLANEQHYELPAEFFAEILGEHRKYSSCLWSAGAETLDDAEADALKTTCRRALLGNNQKILDLGCGWGSLSLWIADNYPASKVTSVSNSASQRAFVESQAKQRGLTNIRVITADMNDFDSTDKFDRVVSVEMFEHMRNYAELYRRISGWLHDDGYFFMHIFCHRSAAYEYVDAGPGDWMSRHFFSGGIMPSDDLPLQFQDHLRPTHHWRWSGCEYQRTAEAWLANMDARKTSIMPIIESVYGPDAADKWWMRWRMFFLAVSELFGSDNGNEWRVGHYLFQTQRSAVVGD